MPCGGVERSAASGTAAFADGMSAAGHDHGSRPPPSSLNVRVRLRTVHCADCVQVWLQVWCRRASFGRRTRPAWTSWLRRGGAATSRSGGQPCHAAAVRRGRLVVPGCAQPCKASHAFSGTCRPAHPPAGLQPGASIRHQPRHAVQMAGQKVLCGVVALAQLQ